MEWPSDEERALIQQVQDDENAHQALERLFYAHRDKIRSLARRYRTPGLDEADLEQEGYLGFEHAVKLFDLGRENRLWPYAYYQVCWYMARVRWRWWHLSEGEHKNLGRILHARRRLQQALQREPNVEEVARDSGLDVRTVQSLQQVQGRRRMPLGEEGEANPEGIGGIMIPSPDASPETRLYFREEVQRMIQPLAPADQPKWFVLFMLKEFGIFDYEWRVIADLLKDASADIAPLWARVCEPLGDVIPPEWSDICRLFPPPTLNEDALRTWYGRGRRFLKAQWNQAPYESV